MRHNFLIKTRGVSTPVSATFRKSVRFSNKEYNCTLLLLEMPLQSYKIVLRKRTIHLSLRRDQKKTKKNDNLKTDGFKTIVSLFFHGKNLPVTRVLNKWGIGKIDRDVMHPRFHYNEMAIFLQTPNIFAPRGSTELQSKLLPLHEASAAELGKKCNFLWSLAIIDKKNTELFNSMTKLWNFAPTLTLNIFLKTKFFWYRAISYDLRGKGTTR